MSILTALRGGWSGTLRMPRILLGLWLVNAIVALPPALGLQASLRGSFGNSLVQRNMAQGFDMGWYDEYREGAGPLGATFSPDVTTGAGPFYRNLEAWITGRVPFGASWIVALGVTYALIWMLLLGGVLDRWARRNGREPRVGFLAAGGRFFGRFLRLALISAVLYFLVYRLHFWVFERLEILMRDVTGERTVLLFSLLAYGLTAFLLTLVHNCFGYAKIATVVEDRRSMFLAALRGVGFVLVHPGRALGLYHGFALCFVLLLAAASLLAPGPGQSDVLAGIAAFCVAQLLLLMKLVLRLSLLGAQMSMYQGLVGSAEVSSSVSLGR